MERPNKQPRNFVSKMFKAFTLYFFVTLSVFFGYTQFFKPVAAPTQPGNTDAYEMKPFQEFMANMMSFQNLETDFSLSFENKDMSLSAEGNVVFEMEGSQLALDIDLIYNEEIFDLQAKYLQPNFYLEINENVYKFDTTSNGGELDVDAILDFVTETLGLDMSSFAGVGEVLGIDFENFDMNAFVAKVTDPEYKKLDNSGHRFVFNISNVISATLDCDQNYDIVSAKVNDILIKGNAIKFNMTNTRMNQPDIDVSYGETGDEVDMTGLTEYIGYAQNTFKNPYVVADVDVVVDDKTYVGKVYYQNDSKMQVKAVTDIEGIALEVAYSDPMVYVDANGLKLSFDINDYAEWETEINQIIENQTSKTVSEFVSDFVKDTTGVDPTEMTAQEQVMAILGALFGNSDKIDAFLPDDTLQTDTDFTMLWNSGLQIKLTKSEELISRIEVGFEGIEVFADLRLAESGFEIAGTYYDVSQMLPLVGVADKILTAEQFGGELTVSVDGEEIDASYKVVFAADLLAEVKLTAFGEDVAIYLSGREVFVQVGEMVISASLDGENLDQYIARVMAMLGKEVEEEETEQSAVVSTRNVIEQVASILSDLKLASEEGKIAVVEYLLTTGHISLDGEVVKLYVAHEGIELDATVAATAGEEIVVPAATDSMDDMLTKAENLKAYVEGQQYAFEFEVSAKIPSEEEASEPQILTVSGTAQIDLVNKIYAVAGLTVEGITLDIAFDEANGSAYVTYKDNKVKASVSSVESVAKVVMAIVEASSSEEDSDTSTAESVTLSDILTEIFGEDVSTLSVKEILKNITADITRATAENDKLTVAAKYLGTSETAKEVSAEVEVKFAGNEIDGLNVNVDDKLTLKADLIEFAAIEIKAEEYYNLTSKQSGSVVLKFTDGVETLEVTAQVELDLSENVYLRVASELAGEQIELLLVDNRVVLSVGEFKVGANLNEASEIWERIKEMFATEADETVSAASAEEPASIGLSITGTGITFEEYELADGLTISGSMQAEQTFTQAILPDEAEVYDIKNVLPLVGVADKILTAEQFGGELTVFVDGEEIGASYKVVFAADLLAEVKLTAFGEDVAIYLRGREVFVQVGEMVISASLDDENLDQYIARVMAMLGKEVEEDETEQSAVASTRNVIEQVASILSDLKLASEEGKIAVVEYLLTTGHISLDGEVVKLYVAHEGIELDATVAATAGEEIVVPAATDSMDDMLTKAENLKAYVEEQQYAFEFEVSAEIPSEEEASEPQILTVSGTAQIDLVNKVYAVTGLTVEGITLDIVFDETNGVAYVTYEDNKVKASVSSVESIAKVVMAIVEANSSEEDSDTSTAESVTLSDILTEIFGEDVSTLSVKEILKNITADITRATAESDKLTVAAKYLGTSETAKEVSAEVEVKFAGNEVDALNVNVDDKLTLKADLIEFAAIEIKAEEYYNLTSKQSGGVVLKFTDGVETLEVTAQVEIDLSENVYLRVTTQVSGEQIELLLVDNRVVLSVGEFKVGANLNEASEIWETIKEMFAAEADETVSAASTEEPASIGLSITGTGITFEEYELADGLTISGSMQAEQTFTQAVLPDEAEVTDISEILPKVSSIKDYVETGVYEFDFKFSYNNFLFEGTFKYFDGEMEVVVYNVCGQENVVIRLHEDMIYVSYGNMKIKSSITSDTGSEIDFNQIVSDLLADAFGIDLQFGAFESVLTMLRDYTWKDYFEKLILEMGFNSDKLTLNVAKDLGASTELLGKFVFGFSGDDLTTISIDLLDVVDVTDENAQIVDTNSLIDLNLSVKDATTSTIGEFNADDYVDYAENYLDGIFDSVKVEEDIYAFSSDIAIRYSTNSFYGKLTAMLVRDETQEGMFGNYVPAISLYTTSLGLSSYIYLINETVYIDINGLQIKADINETTIEEIMAFAEETFGVALAGDAQAVDAAAEAFMMIIPALDEIYGTWITIVEDETSSYGVQIDIGDSTNPETERLYYAQNAYFEDIVVQAFVDTFVSDGDAQGTIIPTKVVLGANINDANTVKHDEENYFKDAWLSNGTDDIGNPIVMEDSVTKKLNFAVYLTNFEVGATSDLGLKNIFGNDLKNISTLKSNYTISSTSEFNPYQNVLDLVETGYEFAMGLEYQASANVTISNSAGTSTAVGGDIVVQLNELSESEIANNAFVLFGNKAMKVQGNLAVTNSTGLTVNNKHLIDLLYQSDNNAALYLTYAHDDYTLDASGVDATNNNHIQLGNKFQAKINNSNMSEIVAMLLAFADVSLGEDMEKSLGIYDKPCTTDFDYIHSLLGIGSQDVSDDISKVDQILSSVESMTKMLNNMKLSKTQMENGLYETTFEIKLNMKHLNEVDQDQIGIIKIVMCEENSADENGVAVVVRKLRQIAVNNLVYGENTINATIDLTDFSESNFDYLTTNPVESHIDFSSLSSFIDVAVSTVNTQNFNFTGAAQVIIDIAIVEIDFEVGVNLLASLSDSGEIYMYIELDIPSIADVTYDLGGFGTTYTYYSAAMGFDKRISIIEFNGDNLTVTQNTYGFRKSGFHSREDKVKQWTHAASDVSSSIMLIMAEALGFTDTIYDVIAGLIEDMKPNPSLEETILGFSYSDTALTLAVDGASLTGDTDFEDMDVSIGLSSDYSTSSRNFKFIDSISTELVVSIVDIPISLTSVSGDSYTSSYTSKKDTTYSKTYYTNNYYRNQYLKKFA